MTETDMRVFVGNVPWEQLAEDGASLKKYLEGSGGCEINHITVPTNFNGRPKGFAFVQLSDESSYKKALELNGVDVGGRCLTIAPAKADKDN